MSAKVREKNQQMDKLSTTLMEARMKIAAIEAIDYPDADEMEMLVSLDRLFLFLFCNLLFVFCLQTNELTVLQQQFALAEQEISDEEQKVSAHTILMAEKTNELDEVKGRVREKLDEIRTMQDNYDRQKRRMTEHLVNARHGAAQMNSMETKLDGLRVR